MHMQNFRLLIVLASMVVESQAGADEAGFRRAIFDGKSLDGWQVAGCEVAVDDGRLVLQSGNGLVRTDHRYRDFILEFEWRPLKSSEWNSGIYFRSPSPKEGQHWPDRYQISLSQGQEGNLVGFDEARSSSLVRHGEWNRMKISVIGTKIRMELNGQIAWEMAGLDYEYGYVGIRCEVAQGGSFEFREIHLTEIGYQSLFNGVDLTGWEGADRDAALCWGVESGELVCNGQPGPWLRSLSQFDDFNLRLDYKTRVAGNSGVYCRVPLDGNHHGAGAGVEIQILDDSAEPYRMLKPYQYCGSVYAIAPALQKTGKPAGEWNTLEINCHGTAYVITHNGVLIVHACEEAFPELKQRLLRGFLGLQNHSEQVWFRNIRIGPAQGG